MRLILFFFAVMSVICTTKACGSFDILEILREKIEKCESIGKDQNCPDSRKDDKCICPGKIDSGPSTKDNKVWFPIFMAFPGNKDSVYDAWRDTSRSGDILTQYVQTNRKKHVRSKFIDNWKNVSEIKVELFDKKKRVVWMNFKGAGTNNENWFGKQNLIDSSFNDLKSSKVFNYFSMIGEQRGTSLDRKFFINQKYGGCAGDFGWFVIADKYLICPWEKKGLQPVFTYTTNNTPRNWMKDGKTADTMIISVLSDM